MSATRILHAVTSPKTLILMRGQLGYLRHAGFDVSVLSSPRDEDWLLQNIASEEQVQAIPVSMSREIAPLQDAVAIVRLYKKLRQLRPALVNYGTPKASLLVGIAARLARVPCRVHTLRGLRSETVGGVRGAMLRWAERTACRSAHLVVCVSQSLRNRAIGLGYTDEQHSRVLNSGSSNGVDAARFAPNDELRRRAAALREQWKVPADAPVIGFVGRLVRDKGIAELVEAFTRLRGRHPGLRLLLIGQRESGDALPPGLMRQLDGDPQIICTGSVPDTAAYYHAMTVFALPTYREGFPNVVLEAQAAGLAVVTTTATGAIDSIVDGATGILVPPRDADALATALSRLLDEPGLRSRLGAAGCRRVSTEFQPQQIHAALVDTYRELLSNDAEQDWSARKQSSSG